MEIKNTIQQIKIRGEQFREEARERTVGYVVASFGLVAGLAWNDAIKAFIEYLFPVTTNTVVAKFIYALIVTVLVVVVTTYLVRLMNRQEK